MSFAAKITKHWKLCSLLGTSVGTYFGFPLIKVYGQANTPNTSNPHESTQLGSSLMKSYQTILHQQNKSVKDFFVSKQYIFYGQSVIRCFRAGFGFSFILSDYIWTYYIHIPYLKSKHPDIDTEQIESRCHDRSSRLLCRVLLKNMGIYVKTGQTIANMTYLFPPEYIQNMKPCLYSTLISPPRDIQYIIERDLHQKIDELFESFDMEPIASASLGQVHRATLKTGEEVAVKIQHRGLLETAPLDMWFIKAIVKTISVVFPKINYNWFAEEMSRNLPVELDFLNEVQNMEICRKMIEPYKHITVPKVHSHLCSSRCLVMSFEEGVQIDKVDPAQEMPSSFYEATDEFISLYLDMVFKHHYLHADPHGGNVLVRTINNNTELVLLDHGLYHHIAPDFLVLYSQFISSIAMNDLDQTRSLLTEILRIGMTMNQDPKMIKRFKAIQLDDNLLDIFMTVLGDKNINGQSIDYSIEERTQLQKLIFSNLEAVCIYVSMLPVDMGFFIKTFDCIRTILYPFNLTTKFFMNLYLDCQKFLTFNDLQQHSSITNYIKSTFYHVYYYIFSVVMSFVA